MTRRAAILCLCTLLFTTLALAGCAGTNRAKVHEEDFGKVFPWPSSKQEVTIRVKPMTTMARTCFLFGSFEEVQVTPDTTFYLVDEMGKKFAYTPSRSPIRRLAPVDSMEIRWPLKPPIKPDEEGDDEADGGDAGTQKPDAAQKAGAAPPADKKPDPPAPAGGEG